MYIGLGTVALAVLLYWVIRTRSRRRKVAAQVVSENTWQAKWARQDAIDAYNTEHAERLEHVGKLKPEQRERYKRYQEQRRSEGRVQVYLTDEEIDSASHPNGLRSGTNRRI